MERKNLQEANKVNKQIEDVEFKIKRADLLLEKLKNVDLSPVINIRFSNNTIDISNLFDIKDESLISLITEKIYLLDIKRKSFEDHLKTL